MSRKKLHKMSPEIIAAIILAVAMIAAALIGLFPSLRWWGTGSTSTKAGAMEILSASALSETEGRIKTPEDGESVPRVFEATGTISGLPLGAYLWLVVEVASLAWPKEPEVVAAGTSWSSTVQEGGNPPGGRFALALYVVTPGGHRHILDWLERGRRTGSYPGLPTVEGGKRLDRVQLRLR